MLTVEHASFGYREKNVIKDMTFSVEKGEFFGILGPNGSGKTTLIKLISGLLDLEQGVIEIAGKDITTFKQRELAKEVAVLPQISPQVFPYTVKEMVSLGRYAHHKGLFQTWTEEDEEIVQQVMKQTNILEFQDSSVMEHSGGEQQRIYLAQALVQRPKVLLLDEPTNHLDLAYQKELLDLLSKSAKEEGLTVIAILHDLNLASLYCDRLLLMEDGRIKQLDNPETVLSEELINPVYRTEVTKQPHSTIAKPQLHLIPGKQEVSADEIVTVDASSLDVAEDYLSIRLDTPIKSLSSSMIGSGIGWYKNFVNQHVAKVESNPNEEEGLQRFLKGKSYRPNQTVATMTFGEEKLHTSMLYEENDYSVFVVLSAGIHSKKGYKSINGINIWIIINGHVTDAVFIQGMIAATAGKTKALIEQKPNHKMNHANSSDTTTGNIVVAATQQGRKFNDSNTTMQVGKEIEKAVYTEVNKLLQAE